MKIYEQIVQLLPGLFKTIIRVLTSFENRITSYVVLAGIGLVATPLWGTFVAALLKRYLDIDIDVAGLPYLGVVLIVVALIFRLLWEWRPERASDPNLAHDTRVAERLKASFNYHNLESGLINMESNHAYFGDEGKQLDTIEYFLRNPRNNFVQDDTNRMAKALLDATKELLRFTEANFFVYGQHQRSENLRFRMHPNLNYETGTPSPEEAKRYDEAADELSKLLRNFEGRFHDFIVQLNKRGIDFH